MSLKTKRDLLTNRSKYNYKVKAVMNSEIFIPSQSDVTRFSGSF